MTTMTGISVSWMVSEDLTVWMLTQLWPRSITKKPTEYPRGLGKWTFRTFGKPKKLHMPAWARRGFMEEQGKSAGVYP
jgi:hypothetical protein